MNSARLKLELRSYSDEVASHHHDHHQLVLPVDGELCLSVNQVEGAVTASQAGIIPAGADHGFYSPSANRFLVADVPADIAPMLERLPAFVQLDLALSHYIAFLCQQMQRSDNQDSTETEHQMLHLLLQLLQQRFAMPVKQDRRIDVARTYLEQQLHRPITLSQLATVSSLSVRQLTSLFQQHLGRSPQQYLLELRMHKARQLLESSDLQVQLVAEQIGYTNLAAFSDRFRRYYGKSPRHFRQHNKQHC